MNPSRTNPRISVVVATRQRPDLLRQCLASLMTSAHDSFEVIVADQSAEPIDLGEDPRVVHLRLTTTGKSAALNAGIAASSGSVIAFTDDDCTVPVDWLTRGAALLAERPEVSLVFGDLHAIDHDPSECLVPTAHFDQFEIVSACSSAHRRGGAGANMFARSSLFDAIGSFDESIGPGARFRACEEFDLYYRTLAAGHSVARAPSLNVLHWGARPYADGSAQALLLGYGYGEGAVLAKHLRLGDRRMVPVAIRILREDSRYFVRRLVRLELDDARVRIYRSRWRGVWAGLRRRVDRRRRVFVER